MTTDPLGQAVAHRIVASRQEEEYPSAPRLQQTAYLIQAAAGVPTKFRFRARYGSPDSPELHNTISLLNATGYTATLPDLRPGKLDAIIVAKDNPDPTWTDCLSEHEKAVQAALSILNPLTDRDLDMTASSHLIASILRERLERDGHPSKPSAVHIAQTLHAIKPRYPADQIERAYQKSLDFSGNA